MCRRILKKLRWWKLIPHVCMLETLYDTPYGISECECGKTFSLAEVAAMEWERILK
jgi:hypothetical protein